MPETPRHDRARSAERRATQRLPGGTRIFASIDGETMPVRDIGPGGICIVTRRFDTGSTHLMELHLQRQHLAVMIEIVSRSDDVTLHARFIDPTAQLQLALQSCC